MSFIAIVNPNGGVEYKRVMKEPFSSDHLLERILSTENVRKAWKQVRANRGADRRCAPIKQTIVCLIGVQCPVQYLVYARHGRELMGCKSPIRESC